MSYPLRYWLSSAFIVVAIFCCGLNTYHGVLLGDSLGPWRVMIAGALAALWCMQAHQKGLFMMKSCPVDYAIFYVLLSATLFLLLLQITNDPFQWQNIRSSYVEFKSTIPPDKAAAFSELSLLSVLTDVGAYGQQLWGHVLWISKQLMWTIVTALLTVFAIVAFVACIIQLLFMTMADIKSGVYIVLMTFVAGVLLLSMELTSPLFNYSTFGAPCLLTGLILATNWGNLRINGDASFFHPRFYTALTRVVAKDKNIITQEHLREELVEAFEPELEDKSIAEPLAKEAEARLVREGLFTVEHADCYRLRFKKRLKLHHAALAMLGTLYILGPTGGIIELIPDNIPIIGNLDEAAILFFMFRAFYDRWRLDRAEARGELLDDPAMAPALEKSGAPLPDQSLLEEEPAPQALPHKKHDAE
jgi:uncharacterized membrane protein YkvA (DUF1232 family)